MGRDGDRGSTLEDCGLRKIEVIVGPAKLDPVRTAVLDSGVVHGMTVEEIRDFATGNPLESPFPAPVIAPRLRIEVAVDAEWAEALVQAICRAADTRRGQGEDRIFVLPMEDAIRIRTGERGAGVL
jgi:nitrogen regulatory protein PII